MPSQSDAPPRAKNSWDGTQHADQELALRLVEVDAPNLLERLAHAIHAMRDVEHPAVLQPLQIVRTSTRLGVITAHFPGVTLAKLLHDASLREESIRPAIALRILTDVLAGLQALHRHSHGFLSRESTFGGVTPDSIHIGLDGQTRYLDPGVASAAARQPRWSHEAAALAYTAPEQTGADAQFDAVSDNFSLGVVLWETLTLRALFGASTAAETLQRVHQAPIPRVQRQQFVRGEPIASALAQVVAQSLRRDPKQRFASYDELAVALEAAGTPASQQTVAELVRRSLHMSPDNQAALAEADSTRTRASIFSAACAAAAQSGPPAAAEAEVQSAAEDLFEPPTTRMGQLPRDSFWPASATWVPSELPGLTQKITAFPIGDLLRVPHATPRKLWSVAAACAAAAGLGLVFWQSTADETPASSPIRAAASAGPSDALDAPARRAALPNSAAVPSARSPLGPVPAQVSDAGNQAAPGAAPEAARMNGPTPATRFHRLPKSQASRNAAPREATATKSQPAPFIPDDI